MKFNRMAGLGVAGMLAAGLVLGRSFDGTVIPDSMPPGAGIPLPAIDINAPGRTADLLHDWAAKQASYVKISVYALEAYGYAAAVMAETRPKCGIKWTTIAAIGSIESQHGTFPPGTHIEPNGDAVPPIRGAALPDDYHLTDASAAEPPRDPPRAKGPFQFIPETWRDYGVDANGDGKIDPDNIDDAALTAARYLCIKSGDMTTAEGWKKAIHSYNGAGSYLRLALARASAYSVGTTVA
ncbi:lytic transglycosylase domain-containing protein [Antrihabitans stalactiti]